MSDLLAIQDNLLKASAEELLRIDLLHMTSKEQNIHKEYSPDSYVLLVLVYRQLVSTRIRRVL